MITIQVYFHGLICHVGEPMSKDRKYSALVRAEHHFPYLNWSGNAGKPFKFKGRNAVLSFHPEPSSGSADGAGDFHDYLPPLSQLAFKKKKTPNKHATLGKDHTKAAGYLRYRAGKLTVATWYAEEGIFCQDGQIIRDKCVPEVTLLTIEFEGEKVELIESDILPGGSVDGPLKPVGTVATFTNHTVILVSNNPTQIQPIATPPVPCDHPTYDHHWRNHLHMTDGDEICSMGKGKKNTCPKYDKDATQVISDRLEPLRVNADDADKISEDAAHEHHSHGEAEVTPSSSRSMEGAAHTKGTVVIMMPGEIVCSNSGFP